MATSAMQVVLTGEALDEDSEITLLQLCHSCSVTAETVEALVEHGILEPAGRRGRHWCFAAPSIRRVLVAQRLQRDLGVNLAGAALALDLLERIARLEAALGQRGSGHAGHGPQSNEP
jgi:chaperone modulatory protein CbpM